MNISKKENLLAADIGVTVTAFGTVLSSIIVLPQTIAKHLFPANSEKARFSFIKDNQQFDSAYVLNNSNSTSEEDENEEDEVDEDEVGEDEVGEDEVGEDEVGEDDVDEDADESAEETSD